MQSGGDHDLLIVTVDMPLITLDLLDELVHVLHHHPHMMGLMCSRQADGKPWIEPFPCILRRAAASSIEQAWQSGCRSMRGLVEAGICMRQDVSHWPAQVWENLNTPEDLERFSRLYYPMK